jgi:hypothetical protein
MVRDGPCRTIRDPATARSVSIPSSQRWVLHDSDAVVFFLVSVMAVSAMYLTAGSAAPLLRKLRGEQQRQGFVLDLVAVVDA